MRTLAFLSALLAVSPALAQEPDAEPVVAAERAFAADAPSLGIAGSFNKWSTPDAIVIGGGLLGVDGRNGQQGREKGERAHGTPSAALALTVALLSR